MEQERVMRERMKSKTCFISWYLIVYGGEGQDVNRGCGFLTKIRFLGVGRTVVAAVVALGVLA